MDTGLVIEGWLGVGEAATQLSISVQRVRQLLHAGELDGRKGPGGWIVADNSVRARKEAPRAAGRPLSSRMAWLVIVQLLAADSLPDSAVELESDRRERHRLRNLLVHGGLDRDWDIWLAHRADVAQYWVHPGLIQSVLTDKRISVSGASVAAAAGAEIAGGEVSDLYLSNEHHADVVRDYGLSPDPAGQLRIHLWRPDSGAEYILRPGSPAPVIIAALDLLGAPDSRARHWARTRIDQDLPRMPILSSQGHSGTDSMPDQIHQGRTQ